MTQRKHSRLATQVSAATNSRNFLTFLLMEQFEAVEIGKRIARARELRGMTQEEVAEMSSFSKRSLQDYEAGTTIPYRHMRELGRLLKKPAEWFLYGDDEDDGEARARLTRLETQLANVTRLVETVLDEVRGLHDAPADGQPAPQKAAPRQGAATP